jgi:hypothetical protein
MNEIRSICYFPNHYNPPNFDSKSGTVLNNLTSILFDVICKIKLDKKPYFCRQKISLILDLYSGLFYATMRSRIVTLEMLKRYVK